MGKLNQIKKFVDSLESDDLQKKNLATLSVNTDSAYGSGAQNPGTCTNSQAGCKESQNEKDCINTGNCVKTINHGTCRNTARCRDSFNETGCHN